MKYDLFNKSLIKESASNIHLSSEKLNILNKYIEKAKNTKFKQEVPNYKYFLDWILQELLDYDIDDIEFENPITGTRNRVEFALKDDSGNIFMIIEVKGQGTNLDKKQSGSDKTPIEQAAGYAFHERIKWFAVSDYDEFRLYNTSKGDEYFSLNITELDNRELFKEFLLLFSKKSYQNGIVDELLDKSAFKEIEFEKEFYKLYHETRLMLIKELKIENSLDNKNSISIAQKILNRFMFIFFAEDRGLLPPGISTNTISSTINIFGLRGNLIWESINNLFLEINDGQNYEFDGIYGYNGGLFKDDLKYIKIRDKVEDPEYFKDEYQKWKKEKIGIKIEDIRRLLEPYGGIINPIFRNLIIISTLDFSSELDVDILGHIFENSIEDIEKLKEGKDTRRNDDGIFYTKEYITDFICKNTIISYLSKSGKANTVSKLIDEYSSNDEINDLYKKLIEIKILDPACGSGAFLNKSADILIEIHKAIHDFKKEQSAVVIETKGGKGKSRFKSKAKHYILDSFQGTVKERKNILKYNIFGVDLNEESVEITKLSLFLSIFKKDKDEYGKIKPIKLPKIDNNIKCGNSIIDDENIVGENAFIWEKRFEEIVNQDGFDVIVGNPPWGAKLNGEEKNFINERYNTPEYQINTYVVFMEKCIELLRNEGYMGIITPPTWLTMHYFGKIRKHLIDTTSFEKVIVLKYNAFDNVTSESSILCVKNVIAKENNKIITSAVPEASYFPIMDLKTIEQSLWQKNVKIGFNVFFNQIQTSLVQKIYEKTKCILENEADVKAGIKPYQKGKGIPKQTKEDVENKIYTSNRKEDNYYAPYIIGGDIGKFYLDYPNNRWMRYGDWLAEPRKSVDFKKDKIVIRRTSDCIMASMDNKGYLNTNSIFNVLINENSQIEYNYLLCLLNSTLIDFCYRYLVPDFGRVFSEVKGVNIRKLPIYLLSPEKQKEFIELVDLLMEYKTCLMEEINEFREWIYSRYTKETSKKILQYYKFPKDQFMDELKNKGVDTDDDEIFRRLNKGFSESVLKINSLNEKIEDIEDEINEKIFDLYELPQEEREIINS
jgi:hypothetical protein